MEGTEGQGHWASEIQSDSITDRDAFVSANSKYATVEDAAIGGFHAQKMAGKPFKFPESMDKLPDDQSRTDFTTEARRLLNINIAKDAEGLKDVNFKSGLAEGAPYNEDFVNTIKNWAIEEGIDTATLGKMAGFYNGPLTKFATEAQTLRAENEKLDKKEACNKGLVEHFKSQEEVDRLSVLMHRALLNNCGLSVPEAEEVVDAMADSIMTENPIMARVVLNALSAKASEGSTEHGSGTGTGSVNQASPYEAKKARFPASTSEWGDPADKWENETPAAKKALGYKEAS